MGEPEGGVLLEEVLARGLLVPRGLPVAGELRARGLPRGLPRSEPVVRMDRLPEGDLAGMVLVPPPRGGLAVLELVRFRLRENLEGVGISLSCARAGNKVREGFQLTGS